MKRYIAILWLLIAFSALADDGSVSSSPNLSKDSTYAAGDMAVDVASDRGNTLVAEDQSTQDIAVDASVEEIPSANNTEGVPALTDVVVAPASDSNINALTVANDTTINIPSKASLPITDRSAVELPARNNTLSQETYAVSSSRPWYRRGELSVGFVAGGAGAAIPVNETYKDTLSGTTQKYKFQLTGEGFSGGLTAAYMLRRGQLSYGLGIGGYLDTFQEWNRDQKDDIYSHSTGSTSSFLKRTYSLEFAPRIGWYMDNFHLYGKLGVICSAFQYKYKDPHGDTDLKRNITAWGGVAGIGIQKPMGLPALGTVNVGLEYNFHLYEALTSKLVYTDRNVVSKLRPRYHNAYLTLSKPL